MNFREELDRKALECEAVLKKYLPAEEGYQKTVLEAMNYSVLAGGKRLRPMLMQESFKLFGGKGDIAEPFMAALEMIHNYSLVHDDLPCMDNDEYRRGRKTTWTVYGEGMAVLAGDALLNYAFETASGAFAMIDKAAEQVDELNLRQALTFSARYAAVGKALFVLAKKAGVYGMIGGQCADIEAEEKPAEEVDTDLLLYIHKNKTAALIECALMIGAILAGASAQEVAAMEKVGEYIGIAFQIQDDILDVTSSTEVLGKPVGSDEKNNKVTYVSLNGLEKAREDVRRLSEDAIGLLKKGPVRNQFLEQLVENLITREK